MSSGVLYSGGYFKGSSCLRFYYYMRTGGYLRVFTKEAASKKKNPYVLIWEREGPQGNKWNVMETSLLGGITKVCWGGCLCVCFFGFAIFTFVSLVANIRFQNFCHFSPSGCISAHLCVKYVM